MRQLAAALALALLADAGCSSSNDDSAGGTSDHVLDASRIFEGSASIRGLVTLPKASSGRGVQIHVASTATGISSGSYVGPAGTTSGTNVAYEIKGLAPGEYVVQMRVDQTGDGMLGGIGDFDGFTGGTVTAPIVDRAKAVPVTVGAGGATGVDFGLAITH